MCARHTNELVPFFDEPASGGWRGRIGGLRSFTYSWLLILIVRVAWMELEDYQGMDVKEVEVCKGSRYQNLWWVKEVEIMVD